MSSVKWFQKFHDFYIKFFLVKIIKITIIIPSQNIIFFLNSNFNNICFLDLK